MSSMPRAFACYFRLGLVKIEYRVPLTCVLTYKLSCSIMSESTLRILI